MIGGDGDERGRLDALSAHLGVADRVMFTGPLPEPDMLEHLARCRVVCFPPVSEDYGFVTVEAFASGKPVITCTDSGGPAELVIGGERGLVCAPTPEAMAKALRRVHGGCGGSRAHGPAGARVRRDVDMAGDCPAVDRGR